MSIWYKSKREDLEIDGDEVNVYVASDQSGNIYTTIKIKDLKDLLGPTL